MVHQMIWIHSVTILAVPALLIVVDSFSRTLRFCRWLPVAKHRYRLYVDLLGWTVQHESSDIDKPPVATLVLDEVCCKFLEVDLDLPQQIPSDVVDVYDSLFQETTIC